MCVVARLCLLFLPLLPPDSLVGWRVTQEAAFKKFHDLVEISFASWTKALGDGQFLVDNKVLTTATSTSSSPAPRSSPPLVAEKQQEEKQQRRVWTPLLISKFASSLDAMADFYTQVVVAVAVCACT